MSAEVIIQLQKVFKFYQVGNEIIKALRNINLQIYKNEYVAIMGPSGSGKSTMMNILGCLDTPTYGQYFLNGKDVSKMNENELAEVRNKEVGFVFQTFNLMPRYTALENVALPLVYAGVTKLERMQRAKDVLEKVGLGDRIKHKPNELSGGQRQRVLLHVQWSTNLLLFLPMNQRETSTRKLQWKLCDCLDKYIRWEIPLLLLRTKKKLPNMHTELFV